MLQYVGGKIRDGFTLNAKTIYMISHHAIDFDLYNLTS